MSEPLTDDGLENLRAKYGDPAFLTGPVADTIRELLATIDALARGDEDGDERPQGEPWRPAGEVGSIVGPAIAGTNDTINSGRARPVKGDVIGQSGEELARPVRGPWKPAGEVGMIIGSGASVVEEPRNDAQSAIRQVAAPGDTVHSAESIPDCLYDCFDPIGCSYPHLGCEHCAGLRAEQRFQDEATAES